MKLFIASVLGRQKMCCIVTSRGLRLNKERQDVIEKTILSQQGRRSVRNLGGVLVCDHGAAGGGVEAPSRHGGPGVYPRNFF